MQIGNLKKIGERFIRIALGEKNLCPFNGELIIDDLNIDEEEGIVYYTITYADTGRKKAGQKPIDEAEALGWISKRGELK